MLTAFAACTMATGTLLANSGFPIHCISIHAVGADKIEWKKDTHDFGEIAQGKPVSVEFSFTNAGNEVFLISEVVPSCGCTVPIFPKEPIAPGKSANIKVTFNAVTMGSFSKAITVKSAGGEVVKVLTIKGTVK